MDNTHYKNLVKSTLVLSHGSHYIIPQKYTIWCLQHPAKHQKKKKKKNLGTKIISTQIKVGNQIQFKKNIYVYGY